MFHKFKNINEFLTALSNNIISNNSKIGFAFRNLSTADVQMIADALESRHCPQGLQIDLGWSNITDAGAQAIARALQSGYCPQGLQIDLWNNNIGAAGAQAIAQALQSGCCPQGLWINLLQNSISDAGATAIAQALQSRHCLREFQINLGDNGISAVGATAIAQALESGHCPQGLQINLGMNEIGDAGATAIAQALQSGHCPQGLQINLGLNEIGDAGATTIAQALESGHCPQGLQINLKNNEIGADGATAIVQALQSGHCPQGLQINLKNNVMSDASIQAIAHVILSGKCQAGFRVHGLNELNTNLKTVLTTLLPSEEILQGSGASNSHSQDNNTHDWPHTFNTICHIFCFDPTIILADEQLKQTIQTALNYYMCSVKFSIAGTVTEEDYLKSYFPVLQTIAGLILTMNEVSQSVPDNQKQWVSRLMLTLADSILPVQADWSKEMSLWARAQQLILIEKAYSLCSDNPSALASHWQSYCDEFNGVSAQRNLELNCDVNNIKANAKNAKAIEYYNQIQSKGLLELPVVETSGMETAAIEYLNRKLYEQLILKTKGSQCYTHKDAKRISNLFKIMLENILSNGSGMDESIIQFIMSHYEEAAELLIGKMDISSSSIKATGLTKIMHEMGKQHSSGFFSGACSSQTTLPNALFEIGTINTSGKAFKAKIDQIKQFIIKTLNGSHYTEEPLNISIEYFGYFMKMKNQDEAPDSIDLLCMGFAASHYLEGIDPQNQQIKGNTTLSMEDGTRLYIFLCKIMSDVVNRLEEWEREILFEYPANVVAIVNGEISDRAVKKGWLGGVYGDFKFTGLMDFTFRHLCKNAYSQSPSGEVSYYALKSDAELQKHKSAFSKEIEKRMHIACRMLLALFEEEQLMNDSFFNKNEWLKNCNTKKNEFLN